MPGQHDRPPYENYFKPCHLSCQNSLPPSHVKTHCPHLSHQNSPPPSVMSKLATPICHIKTHRPHLSGCSKMTAFPVSISSLISSSSSVNLSTPYWWRHLMYFRIAVVASSTSKNAFRNLLKQASVWAFSFK